jgi:hypothetical protein
MTALIALLIRLLPPTLRLREALRRMLGAALRALVDVERGCLNALTQDQLTRMDGALRGYEAAMARLVCGHGFFRAGLALPDLAPAAFDWVGDPRATHAAVLARVGRLLQTIDGLDRYADRHMARLERVTGDPLRLRAAHASHERLRVQTPCFAGGGHPPQSRRPPPPQAVGLNAKRSWDCAPLRALDAGGIQPRAPPSLELAPTAT